MTLSADSRKKNKTKAINNGKEVGPFERPRICCFDIDDETVEALQKTGANLFIGSLGAKVKVPNQSRGENRLVSLNHIFPKNIHEFDIFILDLASYKTVEYEKNNHSQILRTGKSYMSLLSSYPESLFDPRPMASSNLRDELNTIKNRDYLVIVFSSEQYEAEYEFIEVSDGRYESKGFQRLSIYSFWEDVCSYPKYGKELFVENSNGDFQSFLHKHIKDAEYNQTFEISNSWQNNELLLDQRYAPLIKNLNGDIVSYLFSSGNHNLIMLPQIKQKRDFILEFLSTIGPNYYPSLFPYSTNFGWTTEMEYWLPNHATLLEEKNEIENAFKKALEESEKKIQQNTAAFSFLHDIIIETGDLLVASLIEFFKWLGYDKVIQFDHEKTQPNILEEDIQIEIDEGLLIIECKGIGGTSTDSDCGQISKIRHRRCRERNKFDVSALYIVNHQRYIPPLLRRNPPFTEHQIQDAINDQRGLLSTWQLFNLFLEIENGIITKEEARKAILECGLIMFKPSNIKLLYEPTEIFHNGTVCIINIKEIEINVNDVLFIEKDGKFDKAIILDIKLNDESIKQAYDGEFGLLIDRKISPKSKLWKRMSN